MLSRALGLATLPGVWASQPLATPDPAPEPRAPSQVIALSYSKSSEAELLSGVIEARPAAWRSSSIAIRPWCGGS